MTVTVPVIMTGTVTVTVPVTLAMTVTGKVTVTVTITVKVILHNSSLESEGFQVRLQGK